MNCLLSRWNRQIESKPAKAGHDIAHLASRSGERALVHMDGGAMINFIKDERAQVVQVAQVAPVSRSARQRPR